MKTKIKRIVMYNTILEYIKYQPMISNDGKKGIRSFIVTLIEAENDDMYNYFIEQFNEITNKRKEELLNGEQESKD